jgi:hypothetical protein
MNDQHARLSQTLAEQGITERRAQAPMRGRAVALASRASAAGVGGLLAVVADLVVRRSRGAARSSLRDGS